jgi:hypothetical protein
MGAVLLFHPRPAFAEITAKDLQVMIRAIGFLQPAPMGNAALVVVYDPSVQESAAEASQIQTLLADGYSSQGMVLHPKLVNASAVTSFPTGSIVFVTSGIGYCHSSVARSAREGGVLTMSLDRTCVEKGDCVLYVNTGSRVEIVVSKAAAEAANVQFKQTFMLMVTTL